jgi:hypothetical protein
VTGPKVNPGDGGGGGVYRFHGAAKVSQHGHCVKPFVILSSEVGALTTAKHTYIHTKGPIIIASSCFYAPASKSKRDKHFYITR